MKFLEDFRKGMAQGTEKQLIKEETKALKKHSSGEWVYINVIGHKRLMEYLRRGWELQSQDPSDHGSWVRQYMIRINAETLALRLETP